ATSVSSSVIFRSAMEGSPSSEKANEPDLTRIENAPQESRLSMMRERKRTPTRPPILTPPSTSVMPLVAEALPSRGRPRQPGAESRRNLVGLSIRDQVVRLFRCVLSGWTARERRAARRKSLNAREKGKNDGPVHAPPVRDAGRFREDVADGDPGGHREVQ